MRFSKLMNNVFFLGGNYSPFNFAIPSGDSGSTVSISSSSSSFDLLCYFECWFIFIDWTVFAILLNLKLNPINTAKHIDSTIVRNKFTF